MRTSCDDWEEKKISWEARRGLEEPICDAGAAAGRELLRRAGAAKEVGHFSNTWCHLEEVVETTRCVLRLAKFERLTVKFDANIYIN